MFQSCCSQHDRNEGCVCVSLQDRRACMNWVRCWSIEESVRTRDTTSHTWRTLWLVTGTNSTMRKLKRWKGRSCSLELRKTLVSSSLQLLFKLDDLITMETIVTWKSSLFICFFSVFEDQYPLTLGFCFLWKIYSKRLFLMDSGWWHVENLFTGTSVV